jgi:hypothetical protein
MLSCHDWCLKDVFNPFLTRRWWPLAHSFELVPCPILLTGPRRYGLLIASRFPICPWEPGRFNVPWPERILSVDIETPCGLQALAPYDLHDVYRRLHGYATQAYSWYPRRHDPRRQAQMIGRRFDHGFASASLNAVSCTYLHAFRTSGLSDHAALEITFRPEARRRQGPV